MLKKNLALRPNCLLTRWPLIFISGPQSLFYWCQDGLKLQNFISDHGYKIQKISLLFQNQKVRQQSFLNWSQTQKNKSFHFVMAHETLKEFENTLHVILKNSKSTLTVISSTELHISEPIFQFKVDSIKDQNIPLPYRWHQNYCQRKGIQSVQFENTLNQKNNFIYDRFLDHCIKLAENDYIHSSEMSPTE